MGGEKDGGEKIKVKGLPSQVFPPNHFANVGNPPIGCVCVCVEICLLVGYNSIRYC